MRPPLRVCPKCGVVVSDLRRHLKRGRCEKILYLRATRRSSTLGEEHER